MMEGLRRAMPSRSDMRRQATCPDLIRQRPRMKPIMGHVAQVHRKIRAHQLATWLTDHPAPLRPVQPCGTPPQVPAQRLRQGRKQVHRRQGRQDHLLSLMPLLQLCHQRLQTVQPMRHVCAPGGIVHPHCSHHHIERLGRQPTYRRPHIGQLVARAGQQPPVHREIA